MVWLKFAKTVYILSYAWLRRNKKRRRRKKMNKIEIFMFGFLNLVKG